VRGERRREGDTTVRGEMSRTVISAAAFRPSEHAPSSPTSSMW